jgi:hypothetical protein
MCEGFGNNKKEVVKIKYIKRDSTEVFLTGWDWK